MPNFMKTIEFEIPGFIIRGHLVNNSEELFVSEMYVKTTCEHCCSLLTDEWLNETEFKRRYYHRQWPDASDAAVEYLKQHRAGL